jgi:hypothetical protein
VVRGSVLHLLDLHLHRSGIVREGRRLLRPWLRRRGILLRLLCILRYGCARGTLAIPDRDQRSGDENERLVCVVEESTQFPSSSYTAQMSEKARLTSNPIFRCQFSNGNKLDLQLRRRPSHPPRNREPRLQILDHLGTSLHTPHSFPHPNHTPVKIPSIY